MTEPITSFTGDYHFLSNFYPAVVCYNGFAFPTVEHAYVAAKTTDEHLQHYIFDVFAKEHPGRVKKFGRQIQLRDDWDVIKVSIMTRLVEQKFQPDEMFDKLAATGDAELIEGNTWGDRFWGQCPVGTGKNMLGKILMSIRDDISRL